MAESYNGWPASPDKNEIGIVTFGDAAGFPFPGGVKAGDVATVLGYVATQLHTRVEPCINGWCWGYSYKQNVNNPSQLSCHASGTAIDWNAPDHPNGSSNTYSDQQVGTIYAILDEVQGSVSWLSGYDEMHFEICVDAAALAAVAASLPGGGAPLPPTPLPPLEGVPVPLIVKRENGAVDWAWSEDLKVMIRIPSANYYANLEFAGVLPPHGSAADTDTGFVQWLAGQVRNVGGVVYEPTE